ncbi:transposase [Nocardia rhizosphaerihabitans]|uniref:transposase n=1 Tax=Nocardia rhizosphaerihabitans TaxID=1691570 RepID=UPI001669D04C|nr:transposase [Nocardia rhizosphaerihabitans]
MAATVGDRHQVLTDSQWELLELLLPKSDGRVGRNFCNKRLAVEGMLFRLRTGMPWRDLPEEFGQWQTVWKRPRQRTRPELGLGGLGRVDDRAGASTWRQHSASWRRGFRPGW